MTPRYVLSLCTLHVLRRVRDEIGTRIRARLREESVP